ncbi:MAG: glycosyltransferase [Bacteroidetes bacterium]|nr:glycosyltransferase [Bacteroidota bacterium]
MNIWLISLFDPTPIDNPISPRFIEIAKAANIAGHSVTHFTSTFRHTNKQHRDTKNFVHIENSQYKVVFSHSLGYNRNLSIRRSIAHRDYAVKLVSEMGKHPKPDIIFISMPPLSTIYEVVKWGNKMNVPVVVDIIDPWPDSFIKDVPKILKPLTKIFLWPFYHKLKFSLNNSAAITAISKGYLKWASSFHSKTKKTAPFFLAINLSDIQKELQASLKHAAAKDPSILRLIYAGSLANSYDIPTILEAAKILEIKYPRKTKFVITGTGPQKELIESAAEKSPNISYLGWLSKNELLEQYHLADLGLIQHKNSLTQTVTYKFFNYMSCGLPLLNSLQSEMAEMIVEHGLGLNNMEEDIEGLIENIETYLNDPSLLNSHRKNVLAFTKEFGDTKTVYRNLIAFLEETVSSNFNVPEHS